MTPKSEGPSSFPTARHNHRRCVAEALAAADVLCRGRGVRLTRLRRRVLELVWDSHAPVGAYQLLRELSREREKAAPPTVYRALDFLMAQGLIHRIESLNAFVGCIDPRAPHVGQFLICDDCGSAAELHDLRIDRAISRASAEADFTVERSTVEVRGLCPDCRHDQPPES
ncbi:MAG: transcriptional repressor [Kiloniellales bacterium]|nr:transcriptional repressor [Kiloniellales bacterium]